MKPLKLKLQAFGTFANLIEIDFNQLSKDGIFLIVGDTGSGKTTIFDAICYALYGVANGSDRNEKGFRSHFANDKTPTFVNLEFEHLNKIYTINRGFVSGDIYIKDDNNNILARNKKDTTSFIINLIGLTTEQFRQVVMLAQGEFKKFLFAPSDDRSNSKVVSKTDILNKLFGTQIFKDFETLLKNKSDTLKKEYLQQNDIAINNVIQFRYNSSWDYSSEFNSWCNLSNDKKSIQDVLPKLHEYISILERDKKSYSEKLKDVQLKCFEFSDKINDIKTMNNNIKMRDEFKSKLEEILSQECIIDRYQKDIERLRVAQSLEKDYSNYKYISSEVLNLQERLKSLDIDLEKYSNKISDSTEQKNNLIKKYPQANQDVLNYLNSFLKDLSIKLNDITAQGKDLKGIIDSIDMYKSELQKLNEIQSDYNNILQQEVQFKTNYSNQYNRFMFNMAGIMAEQLQDGCKCPVCGSTTHPDKAIKCTGALSKEELDNLKLELESIEEKSRELQNKVSIKRTEIDNLRNNILDRVKNHNITQTDNLKLYVSKLKEELANKYRETQTRINIVKKDIEVLSHIQDTINSLNIKYVSIETSIKDTSEQLKEKSNKMETLKSRYLELLKENSIENESTHLELLKNSKQIKIIEEKVQKYYLDKSYNLKNFEEYSKLVGDNVLTDVNPLIHTFNNLVNKRDDLNSKIFSINSDIDFNTKIYDKSINMIDIIETKRKKYRDAEYLSNVANGTISSENGKIAFDGYVQAYYFEEVLNCANAKIKVMSGGRYILCRKEVSTNKTTRTNLDIEVFDYYTGTKRDVHTLSGGESFMASLSLALGLSEVVQNSSGGIQIDAMFIDEGFGTLDNDLSLQRAMKILDTLATNNRVVGIISHVSELKEHITRKLYVEKSNCGSTIRIF